MTEKRPLYDPEERIFTLTDVKRLFANQRKKIIRSAWIGALLAFSGFLITTSPRYRVHATFKEAANKNQGEAGDLSKLLGGFSVAGSAESQTVALIQSFPVLKALSERMGLQVSVNKAGLLTKVYKRVRDNLLSEGYGSLNDVDGFVFRNVVYCGEGKISYGLRFEDPTHFSLLSGKKVIASGILGSPISLPEVQLTLVKVPRNLRIGIQYPLSIRPWLNAVNEIRQRLQINSNKTMKSIFDLSFFHRDRYFGMDLLNALMEEYRCYMKRDHDEGVKEQLVYLEEKQQEICEKMSKIFDDYTGYLQKNLNDSGQMGLKQEIQGVTKEYSALEYKILAIDLEFERLSRIQKNQRALLSIDNNPSLHPAREMLETISNLKQQRDLIELSLPSSKRIFNEGEYLNKKEELKGIRNRMDAMKSFLERVDTPPSQKPLFDPENTLGAWAARLNDSNPEEREDLAEYLENYVRLLSMQEKIVQERIFYDAAVPSEFNGIDLAMARSLFMNYNGKLDRVEAQIAHFSRLGEELSHSDFEISSLSAALSDPLSCHLIERASETALKLKDEKHRSEKEGGRWAEELILQKKILKDHLDQLYKIECLKAEMIQDKISALQTISLGCISGQISVLEEKLSDFVKERKVALQEEKTILTEKMVRIKSGFQDLPEKWRREKWLNLKTQMGLKMVQALTELVESKTISSHLHHIESKPLDHATLPEIPVHPGLLLKAFLGAFLAAFGTFSFSFLRTLMGGFPSSIDKLTAMRYPTVGQISPFCDGISNEPLTGSDLEAIRQISLFLDKPPQPKIIGIIEGKGPDYSYALAEHLTRMSLRPLVVRCDFNVKFHLQDQPGLLQFWKKETADLPIRMKNGFHLLASGGYTPYGAEVVQSKQFQELLSQIKKNYDYVLLVFRAPLDSVESFSPLTLCDKAIVTVSNEPTEQLTPFVDWAYHEGMCRLSFLVASSG